jgi:hypothetical protein
VNGTLNDFVSSIGEDTERTRGFLGTVISLRSLLGPLRTPDREVVPGVLDAETLGKVGVEEELIEVIISSSH